MSWLQAGSQQNQAWHMQSSKCNILEVFLSHHLVANASLEHSPSSFAAVFDGRTPPRRPAAGWLLLLPWKAWAPAAANLSCRQIRDVCCIAWLPERAIKRRTVARAASIAAKMFSLQIIKVGGCQTACRMPKAGLVGSCWYLLGVPCCHSATLPAALYSSSSIVLMHAPCRDQAI